MSALSYAMTDSATMLRRNLRHALRYPSMTLAGVMTPIIILLLFVGVLGDTLGAGLGRAGGGAGGHATSYVDYVAPGIILMTVAGGCMATAVAVCVDMTGGIINRFRTMAISRGSVLTGHVVGSVIQTLISTALVIGVALLLGFRPTAGPLEWLGVTGLLVLLAFALTWLAVLIGLISKSPESASNTPLLIQFLPFVSSAFVPVDSMPAGVRWFAEHQPFTPIIETVRGLLLGSPPVGGNAAIAAAWCVGVGLIGYLGARAVFNRTRTS
jgi:ABC-2 type transport system permease protein